MADHFILDMHRNVVPADFDTWAKWLSWNTPEDPLLETEVAPGFWVVTFFLGISQGMSRDNKPLVFETGIRHDLGGEARWLYASWETAERGHGLVVSNELTKLMDRDTVLKPK